MNGLLILDGLRTFSVWNLEFWENQSQKHICIHMHRRLHSRYCLPIYCLYVGETSTREVVILVGFKKQHYWSIRFCLCPSLISNNSFAHWPNFKLATQISFFWAFSLDSRALFSSLVSPECQRINDAWSSLQAIVPQRDNLNHVFYGLLEFLNWI